MVYPRYVPISELVPGDEPVPGDAAAWIEHLCEVMHDAYEKAAIGAGWETQQASRKPWANVPEANKQTMRAAVRALLSEVLPAPRPQAGSGVTESARAT